MLFALSVFLSHAAVKTLPRMQAFVYGVDTGLYTLDLYNSFKI